MQAYANLIKSLVRSALSLHLPISLGAELQALTSGNRSEILAKILLAWRKCLIQILSCEAPFQIHHKTLQQIPHQDPVRGKRIKMTNQGQLAGGYELTVGRRGAGCAWRMSERAAAFQCFMQRFSAAPPRGISAPCHHVTRTK